MWGGLSPLTALPRGERQSLLGEVAPDGGRGEAEHSHAGARGHGPRKAPEPDRDTGRTPAPNAHRRALRVVRGDLRLRYVSRPRGRRPVHARQLPRALAAPSPQPAVLGGQQRPGPARRTRFRDHCPPANSSGSKKCCGKLHSGTGPCDSVNCKPAILAVGRAGWASVTAEGAAFSGLAPRGSVERRACATGCRRRPPRARPHAGQEALLGAQRKAEDGASSARTRRPSGPRFFALSFQLSPVPLSLDPEKGPGS